MNLIERFERLAERIENRQQTRFYVFAMILTRKMHGVISTSSTAAPHSHDRWAVIAAAPWLRDGRLNDVERLTAAIVEAGDRDLLQLISRVIVLPSDSRDVRILAELGRLALPRKEIVTPTAKFDDPHLNSLFGDAIRVRVLKSNIGTTEALT